MRLSVVHGFETDQTAYRPVVQGRHLVVACGHYLASMAGMRMLALGGNAVDAGVAMVLAQVVLEFHAAGFGGECPILIYSPQERRVVAINGNTNAPLAASIERYRSLGVSLIPDDGFLAAGVCATPAALLLALERHGSLSFGQVAAPACELAADGFPMYDQLWRMIDARAERFRSEWPTSAALFLPGGQVPAIGETWRNPDLAATFEKMAAAEHDAARSGGRVAGLRAALDRFYRGDIARRIVEFQRDTTTRHAGGAVASGLLTEDDFARYQARLEAPVTTTYRGYTVCKCGPWSQGPVFLQQLNLLAGFDLRAMGAGSADAVHTVVEASKLAFADRDTYYADPDFVPVPLRGLLSREYAAARRPLIDPARANNDWRPGDPWPYDGGAGRAPVDFVPTRPWQEGTTGTRALDASGLLFSATPSGGWARSSPIIAGLGFCLGTRLQMFWLDPRHPAALRPGMQPRTTLTPSLVLKDGLPYLGFGTPGGDQQDQWTLQFFLNHVDFGMDIQAALDFPAYHHDHAPASFYPRRAQPGHLTIESSFPAAVLDTLAARGHVLTKARPFTLGNVTAVQFDAALGRLLAAATCRGQKCYALGW